MFDQVIFDRSQRTARRSPVAERQSHPAFFLHQLHKGERLFRAGERKRHLYRVESGLISISWTSPDGMVMGVESAGPNSFFGLGYLDTQIYDAIALPDSMVSCWPLNSLAFIIEQFPDTRDRQNHAVEREFAHRRATLMAAAPAGAPAARLAGFLAVISRMNANEGRDPLIISETTRCPVVADYLKIDIASLSDALLELHHAGLVAAEDGGRLRLCDLARLESYASLAAAEQSGAGHGR